MRHFGTSQIKRLKNPERYVYTEIVSKTNSGTFQQLSVPNKVVPVYSCPEAGERCAVYLLDLYLSKLSQEAFTNDIFYLRPLEKTPSDPNVPWYSAVPVGKNTLEKKLSCICEQAGIEGTITNHSLRATSATHMYISGVPEKVIQERIGHRSLEALRVYERSNSQQHEAASSVLMSGSNNDAYANPGHQVAYRHSMTMHTSMSFASQIPCHNNHAT